ncbi:WD40 repeat domain-containing protein [Spirillospora sp. CA-108201]
MFQSSPLPDGPGITDLDVVTVRDQTWVVCATFDGKAWLWDPSSDRWTHPSLPPAYEDYPDAEPDLFYVAAGVHRGRMILAGGSEHHGLAAWDLDNGAVLRTSSLDEDDRALWSVTSFEVDGQLWFACGGDYNWQVSLWGPSGGELMELDNSDRDAILSLVGGQLDHRTVLAAGGFDAMVALWDLPSRERIATFSHVEGIGVRGLALTSLGRRPVVVGGDDRGDLYVWDADGSLVTILNCHDVGIMSVDATVADGRTTAVTAAEDGTVRTWDLAEGRQCDEVLVSGKAQVLITRFGGRQVAVAGDRGEGIIRCWYLS